MPRACNVHNSTCVLPTASGCACQHKSRALYKQRALEALRMAGTHSRGSWHMRYCSGTQAWLQPRDQQAPAWPCARGTPPHPTRARPLQTKANQVPAGAPSLTPHATLRHSAPSRGPRRPGPETAAGAAPAAAARRYRASPAARAASPVASSRGWKPSPMAARLGFWRNWFSASSLWYTHDTSGERSRSPTNANVFMLRVHAPTCARRRARRSPDRVCAGRGSGAPLQCAPNAQSSASRAASGLHRRRLLWSLRCAWVHA